MKNISLVSVIIPTHNRKDLLKRAIYSALNQTYTNIEIIVVDDQSTDGTNDYISTLQNKKIKYIRNENIFQASQSRNIGINHAKGEFIAFLDDDDEWLPEKLEKQLPLFNNIKVGIVYSSITLHFERYNLSYITGPEKRGDIYKNLLINNFIGGTVSVVVRKKALEEITEGYYFDRQFPAREEYDLWIRLSKEWEVEYIKEPLVTAYYRHSITRISTDVDNYVKAINLLNIKYDSEIKQVLSDKELRIRRFFQQFFLGSQAIKNYNANLARKYYWKAFKINRNTKAIGSFLLCFFGARAVIVARCYFNKIFG